MFSKKLSAFSSARVTGIKETAGCRKRPLPMNTVEMLKLASKVLGMGPKECTVYAERLYLKGYISYPRTESSAYPEHYDILWCLRCYVTNRGTVEKHASNPQWGSYVSDLIAKGLKVPRRGVDMGDHPPITPVASVDSNALAGGEAALYDLISKHFLSTVSDGGGDGAR